MFDFGIERVSRFNEIACYGRVWLVEFRDGTKVIVLENGQYDGNGNLRHDYDDEGNFILEEE